MTSVATAARFLRRRIANKLAVRGSRIHSGLRGQSALLADYATAFSPACGRRGPESPRRRVIRRRSCWRSSSRKGTRTLAAKPSPAATTFADAIAKMFSRAAAGWNDQPLKAPNLVRLQG